MDEAATPAFRNDQLQPGDIPDYRAAEFVRPPQTFRRYTLLSSHAGWAPLLLVPLAMRFAGDVPVLLAYVVGGAIVALVLWITLYRWVDAGFRGWALREHDLIARIQHVETTSGPLERVFGLARLKLYTAGGMTADLTVIGLLGDTADALREHLVEQIRLRDAADGRAATCGARRMVETSAHLVDHVFPEVPVRQ